MVFLALSPVRTQEAGPQITIRRATVSEILISLQYISYSTVDDPLVLIDCLELCLRILGRDLQGDALGLPKTAKQTH